MKKHLFILVMIMLMVACQKEESAVVKDIGIESFELIHSDTITRALNISATITPESGMTVGYTSKIKVNLGEAVTKAAKVSIFCSSYGAWIESSTNRFAATITKTINKGQKSFEFTILPLEKGSFNLKITPTSDNQGDWISGEYNVNFSMLKRNINAPAEILPEKEFTASISYDVNTTAVWEYDKTKFTELNKGYDSSARKYNIKLKASSTISAGNKLRISIPASYTTANGVNQQFTFIESEHTINIISPYAITTNDTQAYVGKTTIFTMKNYNQISNPKVTWIAGDGLKIISGESTGEVKITANEGYSGMSNVKAQVTYNGKTWTETGPSIWVGKPRINRNGYTTQTIQYRTQAVKITPTFEGIINTISWKVVAGNATVTPATDKRSAMISSTAPKNLEETVKIAVDATNEGGTTSEVFEIKVIKDPIISPDDPSIPFDQFAIINPQLYSNGTRFKYDLVYKAATKPISFQALYVTFLYPSIYDWRVNWDWESHPGITQLMPPKVDLTEGYTDYILDARGYSFPNHSVLPGEIYSRSSGMYLQYPLNIKIKDIETILVHTWEPRGNGGKSYGYDYQIYMYGDIIVTD
ncbi:MAG: hypothetical protein LUH22_19950 [Bacteroides sp.]|nr:hypothetical protein [Bacteroides sp.]